MAKRADSDRLNVWHDATLVGELWRDGQDRIGFAFHPEWLQHGFGIGRVLPLREDISSPPTGKLTPGSPTSCPKARPANESCATSAWPTTTSHCFERSAAIAPARSLSCRSTSRRTRAAAQMYWMIARFTECLSSAARANCNGLLQVAAYPLDYPWPAPRSSVRCLSAMATISCRAA